MSKKLHDAGFGSITVTAVRYLALVAVATVLALGESRSASSSLAHAGLISISGLALIVAPTFVLQMGVARTPALLAQVVRSLGPVFVFALELVDGRVIFSRPVLFAILVYSVSAIAATLARRFQPAP